ncbi:MAG TPA: nitronate monooxygenase [Acidimicrobiia bacterium]|nr:nitronate monooxygenase [Acidimicrobiia bacterium]
MSSPLPAADNLDVLDFPKIIQGGMGIAVSGYRLANSVGKAGQMGVVSGTVIDVVHARELQNGDPSGDLRRAYSHFPYPQMVENVLDTYFIKGGKDAKKPFKNVPSWEVEPPQNLVELCLVANFAEVFLAKENHRSPIGINYLEKIQLPVIVSTLGAMLAGVDAIIMGAGIPKQMPKLIRDLARGKFAEYKIDVQGAQSGESFSISLDPKEVLGEEIQLMKPKFLAIISSNTLASFLLKDEETKPDGFVIELPTAGGHNSPPRGKLQLDEVGQPIYGDRDMPDLSKFKDLGIPFWIAGGWGKPTMLKDALDLGAQGIQVGTAFAFSKESGFSDEAKSMVIKSVKEKTAKVFTDPVASPSGFPFKVVEMDGTASQDEVYEDRTRVCDLGYLRSCYRKEDGTVGYRCSAEPINAFVRKGGSQEETIGRKCLCNALMSNIGLGQIRKGEAEPVLITSGDDLSEMILTLTKGNDAYSATDVIQYLNS